MDIRKIDSTPKKLMQITDLLLRYVWISVLFAKRSGRPCQMRAGGEAQVPADPQQLLQEPHCRAGCGATCCPQLLLGVQLHLRNLPRCWGHTYIPWVYSLEEKVTFSRWWGVWFILTKYFYVLNPSAQSCFPSHPAGWEKMKKTHLYMVNNDPCATVLCRMCICVYDSFNRASEGIQ